MAFETIKGAVARPYNAVNAQLTNAVNNTASPVHNGFDRFFQKALPASITAYLTSATFLAGSYGVVQLAEKLWTPIPAATQPPAPPAVDPNAKPPVATPARPWGIYGKNILAGSLVATSAAINFAVVSIWKGGATPLAYVAAVSSVVYFNRVALLAKSADACAYVWSKVRPGVQTEVTKLTAKWTALNNECAAIEADIKKMFDAVPAEIRAIYQEIVGKQTKAQAEEAALAKTIAEGSTAVNFLAGRASKLRTAVQNRENLEKIEFHAPAAIQAHNDQADFRELFAANQRLAAKKRDLAIAYQDLLKAQAAESKPAPKKAEDKKTV